MASDAHPLLAVLEAAAIGRFPAADGRVTVLPRGTTAAVVGFTMRHYILTDLPEAEVRRNLDPTNFAAPMLPPFMGWFAERQVLETGFSDIVLATVSPEGVSKILRRESSKSWADHSRVARALHHRGDVELWTTDDEEQVAIFGEGVAGRLELSIEIAPELRGAGLAADLIVEAVLTREQGTPVFAQVSPGNVASLRAFLNAGFKPICAEVIFAPPEGATVPA